MGKEMSRRQFLKLAGVAGLGAGLAACGVVPIVPTTPRPDGEPPTSRPDPTATKSATATKESTKEATQEPTKEPTATKELVPDFREEVTGEYRGVSMKAVLVTDSSLMSPPLTPKGFETKVRLHDKADGFQTNFKNKYGENARDSLFHAISYTYWQAWGGESRGSYNYFMAAWAKAQKSNAPKDWDAVKVRISTSYDGFKEVNPTDMEIVFTHLDSSKYKGKILRYGIERMGTGVGVEVTDGSVKLLCAYDTYQSVDVRYAQNFTAVLAKNLNVIAKSGDKWIGAIALDPYKAPQWGFLSVIYESLPNAFYSPFALEGRNPRDTFNR